MKILFMGTPDFAAAMLSALHDAGFDVIGAVSQPDKPKGRGHKLMPTEVKIKAQEFGIQVFQPQTLKDNAFESELKELDPDMIVVAAYGKLLPDYVIDYPKYGCINVHPSLLPRYRGAAPVQRAVINGDAETGACIMRMDYGLDTGDVILCEKTEIGEYETSGELFGRMEELCGRLLVDAVKMVCDGTAEFKKQSAEGVCYAERIRKDESLIDWTKPAAVISKLICGMAPAPLASTTYKGSAVKIISAEKAEGSGKPGEILKMVKGRGMLTACGEGALLIKTVKFAGSKQMGIEDYARGHEIEIGAVLGE